MKKDNSNNAGIELLLMRYRKLFRINENTEFYSNKDYKKAEKKFLKYALSVGKINTRNELSF